MKTKAFSLIELLVVIAIVALLAAIIFPVFSSVQENNRASTAMSNMHDISSKMEQYRLDTHHYPPAIFGYAKTGVPMDKLLSNCTAANDCGTYLVGIYPEYIRSLSTFQDPNNPAKMSDETGALPTIGLLTDDANAGVATAESHDFYKADAYEVSPLVDGTGLRKDLNYVPRYQQNWTSITSRLDCGPGNVNPAYAPPSQPDLELCPDLVPIPTYQTPAESEQKIPFVDQRNNYMRQLRWTNPPGNTYITCTTWHVPQSDYVIVLFADGSAKKVAKSRFLATGPFNAQAPDVPIDGTHPQPDISPDPTTGVSRANFWRQQITLDR